MSIDIRLEPGDKQRRHIYIDNELRGYAVYRAGRGWLIQNAVQHPIRYTTDPEHRWRNGQAVTAASTMVIAAVVENAHKLGLLRPLDDLRAEEADHKRRSALHTAKGDYDDLIARHARVMLNLLRHLSVSRDFRVRVHGPLQDEVHALVEKLKVPLFEGAPIEPDFPVIDDGCQFEGTASE